MLSAVAPPSASGLPDSVVDRLWRGATGGVGPFVGARSVAEDALGTAEGNVPTAVRRVVGTHVRLAASSGLLTSLGGAATLVVTAPAGVTGLYLLATRMAAAIAHLHEHDLAVPAVRTGVLVCVLGADGVELAEHTGLDLQNASLLSGLRRLPPEVREQLDARIGFRLTSHFTRRGALNLTKLIPVVSGPIGAGADAMSMRTVATFAQAHL